MVRPMAGTAFVAGATGYTGRFVVEHARARKMRCFAHMRPGSSAGDELEPKWSQIGAEVVRCPWEPDALRQALEAAAPDVVFSLLGTTRKRAAQEGMSGEDAYDRVDRRLSVMLLEACEQLPTPPRFVYLSSLGANSGSNNAYLAARGKVEDRLAASSLPHVIVQPSFISGEDRPQSRPAERIGAVVSDGVLSVLGALGATRLRDRYASLTGEELGRALVAVSQDSGDHASLHLKTEDLRKYL